MLLAIDIVIITRYIAWTTFSIIIFIILYRLLLKKFKEGRLNRENYFILHPIENEPAKGTIQIFIEMHFPKEIEITIFSIDKGIHKVIEKKEYQKGGNIIQVDTTQFENGMYFYQAKSELQKTRKKFEILN